MTQDYKHPIIPPQELREQWREQWFNAFLPKELGLEDWMINCASQWGADQELDACCEWMNAHSYFSASIRIREDRRPKPPSLKEQGIKSLDNVINCLKSLVPGASVDGEDIKVIRRALEQLDD